MRRVTVHYSIRGLVEDDRMRCQVEADLGRLGSEIPVIAAEVTLAWERESMPPVQAVTVLRLVGRELRAAARDHTWQAAWSKVVSRLEEQFRQPRRADGPDGRAKNEGDRPANDLRRGRKDATCD
jgi:ribosome-associated translation inhibitor RaiA